MKNQMSDLKSARYITKALQFLRYAYVFSKRSWGRNIVLRVGQCYAWDKSTCPKLYWDNDLREIRTFLFIYYPYTILNSW